MINKDMTFKNALAYARRELNKLNDIKYGGGYEFNDIANNVKTAYCLNDQEVEEIANIINKKRGN